MGGNDMKSNPCIMMFTCSLSFSLTLAVGPQVRAQDQNVPHYKVDPFWPKELPNNWIMQGVPRIAVDKDDHIWIISRESDINTTAQLDAPENGAAQDPPTALCCKAAPAVLEFDAGGNLLKPGAVRATCRVGPKEESTRCSWINKEMCGLEEMTLAILSFNLRQTGNLCGILGTAHPPYPGTNEKITLSFKKTITSKLIILRRESQLLR
jgi:hypothetical protein